MDTAVISLRWQELQEPHSSLLGMGAANQPASLSVMMGV